MTRFIDRFLTKNRDRLAPFIFVFAALLYLLTMARAAVVGESASLVALHQRLHKFPPMSHFLWGWLIRAIFAVFGKHAALVANGINAMIAALSLTLLYQLVVRVPRDRTAEENEARVPWEPLQCISGIVAVLFLALCMPFWIIATRAYPAALDLFLLLLVTWLLVRFVETQRRAVLFVFAFLYGVGATEFATLIVLAPIFALAVWLVVWQSARHHLASTLATAAACFVAGLFPYVIGAIEFRFSPAFEWREFSRTFDVFWFIWREQYREIRYSLPYVGGMLVFLVCGLPWIVVAAPKRAMTRNAVLGSNFFHAVLGLLALAVAYNVRLAPWSLFRDRPLLVTPYVLVASWAGYVAGYWYLFFFQQSRFEMKGRARMRAIGRALYVPALLAALVVAGARNFPQARGSNAVAINQVVRHILTHAGADRAWMVTYGTLDDVLAIEAHLQQRPLKLINVRQMAVKSYRRYVASLFSEPRLQGLAALGIGPLLSEWVRLVPDAEKKVAVIENADLWYGEGFTPVPRATWFEGVRDIESINLDALLNEHQQFWENEGVALREAAMRPSPSQPWLAWTLLHVSKVANNLGVLCEEFQRLDDAVQCYRAALNLDTNNISAILNWLWLADREKRPEKDELLVRAEDLVSRLGTRRRVWALAQQCGYVRAPEAFMRRGWAWAMSGKVQAGARELRKAAEAGAPHEQIDLIMAATLAFQDQPEESESIYDKILAENPGNVSALFGKLRVVVRRSEFEKAMAIIKQLRDLGVPEDQIAVEEAVIELADGNKEAALDLLTKVVEQAPKNLRAWSLLAMLTDKPALLEKAIPTLKAASRNSPEALWALAVVARAKNDFALERNYLEQLLRLQPRHMRALERLLERDVYEAKRDDAERRIEQILNLRPDHAVANYILGTIQYSRGELAQAEASYRASIERGGPPAAYNDLAWILQKRGNLNEARELILEALKADSASPVFNDTAGVIFTKLRDWARAQEHLQKALAAAPEHPEIQFHLALLYEQQGLRNEAKKIAEALSARYNELTTEGFEELRKLTERLR